MGGKNRQYLLNMSYLEVFGVSTGVGVDVSKFCGVGAGVLKHGAGTELSLKNVTPLISAELENISLLSTWSSGK